LADLHFSPQEIFAPAYYTDAKEIIERRTFFREEYDFFVDVGGRGGGKTVDKVKSIVLESTIRSIRVLIARELQNSIEESVKAEIEACIEQEGLQDFFRITDKNIVGLNGSRFMFKGIKNNINNLKSIADVDIVLIEESENVSQKSWDKLLPSIRPKSGRAIVVIIFNPADELDPTYQTWLVNTPARTLITNVNYCDNKYFPPFLEQQRLHCLKTRPKREYDNIWEGIPLGYGDDAIIDREWVRAARFASNNPDFIHCGDKRVSYDPAGQGKDNHAVVYADGNIIKSVDEWLKSDDLREATIRAFTPAIELQADRFIFDSCGGWGDGVSVFVDDEKTAIEENIHRDIDCVVFPFDAGSSVVNPDDFIPGTDNTWKDLYSNAKAQAHAITAQKLYNTFRFVKLGERDIDPIDMMSIDIEDNDQFNQIVKELSCPIWVKSSTNSKKKVESKKDMEKRTGQPSPNVADGIYMISAPMEEVPTAGSGF